MDINRSRIVQDKDNVGGLRAAYFVNYDETMPNGGLNSITFDTTAGMTDVIAQLAAASDSVTLHKYDLRGTSSLSQTLTPSRENGTIFAEQTLTLSLKKLSAADHNDMYALASQRPQIIVEDYNGRLQLVGLEYGADMDASTIETGAAMGDMSGYSYVFKAMEKKPANILADDAIWTTGNIGSLTASDIYAGISIVGGGATSAVAGTATR